MSDIVERLRAWSPLIAAGLEVPAASLTMDEAAAEITRLRNELHIVEVWSARIIAGTQQDVIEITRLRAELRTASDMNNVYESRLQEKEAENTKLRAALDEAQQAFALESYNAVRLREALKEIAKPTYGTEFNMSDEDRADILGRHLFAKQDLARAALSRDKP